MLNIISTCWDILCVDINVDKRSVDHSTKGNLSFFQQFQIIPTVYATAQLDLIELTHFGCISSCNRVVAHEVISSNHLPEEMQINVYSTKQLL